MDSERSEMGSFLSDSSSSTSGNEVDGLGNDRDRSDLAAILARGHAVSVACEGFSFKLRLYRWRRRLEPFRALIYVCYMGIPFFQVPEWAGSQDSLLDSPTLHESGVPIMRDNDANWDVSALVEFCLLLGLFGFTLLQHRSNLFDGEASKRLVWQTAVIIIAMLDTFVSFFILTASRYRGMFIPRLGHLIRPFIVLLTRKGLTARAWAVKRSFYHVFDSVVALVLCMFMFASLGTVLLSGHSNFDTLVSGLWSFAIFFTTANSPDIWLEPYKGHNVTIFFFILFQVVTVYSLTNLILASVNGSYKEHIEATLKERTQAKVQAFRKAFELMSDSEAVSLSSWTQFCIAFERRGSLYLASPNEELVADVAVTIFSKVQGAKDELTFEEFSEGIRLLEGHGLVSYASYKSILAIVRQKNKSKPTRSMECMGWFLWERKLGCVTISHEIIIDVLAVLAGLAIYIFFVVPESANLAKQWREHNTFKVGRGLMCFLLDVDMLMKLYVFGFGQYFKRVLYTFDFITLTTFNVAFTVFHAIAPAGSRLYLQMIRIMLAVQIVRSWRPLRHVRPLRNLASLFFSMADAYGQILTLILLTFYFFAALGIAIFGGLIWEGNPALQGSNFEKQGYWPLNFNDFASSMTTLFAVMLLGNWQVIAEATSAVTNRWAPLYFICFYLLVHILLLNILVAVIIDCHELMRKRSSETDTSPSAALVSEESCDEPVLPVSNN